MNTLTRNERQLLASLELVSAGTIYSYAPVASKGGFASTPPVSGDAHPPHVRWRRALLDAATDHERGNCLAAAREELEALTRRRAPARTETRDQRDRRMLKDGQGFTAIEVATRFRCGLKEVHAIRRAANRDIQYGNPIHAHPSVERPDRVARARDLRDRHPQMSYRQIAAIVGCDHKTIATDLAAA